MKYDDDDMNLRSEESFNELVDLIAKTDDPEFLGAFFKCLFTPAEVHDIADRWLLVKEIEKGTTQREIARKLRISLCKITRGSRELKKEDSAFRKMLNMLNK
ncbi:MAG: trp operon repressor [Treponemataceae bacterium]|nr:trp operon repressor [Treponemataceae bacterium]